MGCEERVKAVKTPADIFVLCALTTLASACGHSPTLPTPISAIAPGVPRVLPLAEPLNGTVAADDGDCEFTTLDGGWGGLCEQFDLMPVPQDGLLSVVVNASAQLVVFLKTPSGDQIDIGFGGLLRVPIDANTAYRIEVADSLRPVGYPHIAPVPYTITAAIIPLNDALSANAQVILLGDAARTQRLSRGRVEVAEGLRLGATGTFDPSTGLYEVRGLPAGFVQLAISAEGFIPQTVRVPVGTNIPAQIVMTRVEPILNGVHRLFGSTSSDGRSCWSEAVVEILDGPLAGIFTLSDEMCSYNLDGVPPGPVTVRASRYGKTQTLIAQVPLPSAGLTFYLPGP